MTENNEELIEKVETNDYKCPECGAPMGYNPTRDSLSCEYCGKVINLSENNSSFEEDFFNVKEEDLNWQNETQVVKCENCGSENVLSKREISLTCPFCNSKQVVSYDAIGVRYESGKQAAAINDIVDELEKKHKKKYRIDELKEQLGHKPYEVMGGALLGFVMGSLFYLIMF